MPILNAITNHQNAQLIPSSQKRVSMVMKPRMLKLVVEMMRVLVMPMKMKMSEW